jgi:hypothetical protein
MMEDLDQVRRRRSGLRNLVLWILVAVAFVYLWTSALPPFA